MNPNAKEFVFNPNARAFVPSFVPSSQPPPTQTPVSNPAPHATLTPQPTQVTPPTHQPQIQPQSQSASIKTWEDVDEDIDEDVNISNAPPPSISSGSSNSSNVEHKPTESVFKIEEDDLEIDEEEVTKEIEKLRVENEVLETVVPEDPREHVNVVFIGHVDAGKSTISGQIMLLTDQVDKRTLQKFEKEAKDNNRESWFLAYIMDTNEEERAKGKTVEVGRAHFETKTKRYTILDAPGHRNYVPNMITGASQADVAILVISAKKGEFEAGFGGGQTIEHARLVKTTGVKYLIVAINKMDEPSVQWSKERYDDIVGQLSTFLKKTGYNLAKEIIFLPISGYTGANMKEPVGKVICPWYDGLTLLGTLDNLPSLDRKVAGPLRIPITGSYKERGTLILMGKIESGTLTTGQSTVIMPSNTRLDVVSVANYINNLRSARPGENIMVSVKGSEDDSIGGGYVLCDVVSPCPVVTEFDAMMVLLDLQKEKSLMTAGYEAILHVHTAVEEVQIIALLAEIDMRTQKEIKKRPMFVKSGAAVRCRLQTSRPVCIETFKEQPQLGRFTLRDAGRTIAFGKVLAVGEKKKK